MINSRDDAAETPAGATSAPSVDQGAIQRLLDRPIRSEDLNEATERVARPDAPTTKQYESLLEFELSNEKFAIPVAYVLRVTRPVVVRRIPHRTNLTIRGMCCVDGELLICVDLANLMEISDARDDDTGRSVPRDDHDDRSRLIVFGEANRPWAAEVDVVSGVTRTDPTTHRAPPLTVEHALKRYTISLVPVDDGVVSLLDVQSIVAGLEAVLP